MKIYFFLLPLTFFLFLEEVEATRGVCFSCCYPALPFPDLTAEIYIPISVIGFLVYYCYKFYIRKAIRKWRKSRFESSYCYNCRLPTEGSYEYKVKSHKHIFEWNTVEPFILTFNDNQLAIEEKDKPDSRREGPFDKNGIVEIPLKDDFCGFRLYATELPGTGQVGFVGFNTNGCEELWVLLPNDYQGEVETMFPYLKNFYLILVLGAIIVMSSLCIITFALIQTNGFFYEFFIVVIGTPWGAFISFLGIAVIFFLLNPFGYVFYPMNSSKMIWCHILFSSIFLLCVIFSVFDMMTADFLNSQSMIDTKGSYTLDHAEIAGYCKMNQYDCSVYWSSYYTSRNSGCNNSYYYMCISFQSQQGSCTNGNVGLFNLFVVQSLFECFLAVLWGCAILLVEDINQKYRWPSVEKKLIEWNTNKSDNDSLDYAGKKKDVELVLDGFKNY